MANMINIIVSWLSKKISKSPSPSKSNNPTPSAFIGLITKVFETSMPTVMGVVPPIPSPKVPSAFWMKI